METYLAHVKAGNPKEAVFAGLRDMFAANEWESGGNYGTQILAVFAGHLPDLYPGDGTESAVSNPI